jgi:hypothetical protein
MRVDDCHDDRIVPDPDVGCLMTGHPDHRGLGRVFPDRLVGYSQVKGALQDEEGRDDSGRPEPLAEVLDPCLDARWLDCTDLEVGKDRGDMQPVSGLIPQHGGRIHNPGGKPFPAEIGEKSSPRIRVMIFAALPSGFHRFPVRFGSDLFGESPGVLLAVRAGPAREPAFAPAPPLIGHTAPGPVGSGPQVLGVAHLSLLLFNPDAHVFRLIAQVAANATALRADTPVPPLVESRHGNAAEEC